MHWRRRGGARRCRARLGTPRSSNPTPTPTPTPYPYPYILPLPLLLPLPLPLSRYAEVLGAAESEEAAEEDVEEGQEVWG